MSGKGLKVYSILFYDSKYRIVRFKGFNGAALLNENRKTFALNEVVALATNNNGCNNTHNPTVFVRISKVIHWIEAIVWPDDEPLSTVRSTIPTENPATRPSTGEKLDVTTIVLVTICATVLIIALVVIVTYFKMKALKNHRPRSNLGLTHSNSIEFLNSSSRRKDFSTSTPITTRIT